MDSVILPPQIAKKEVAMSHITESQRYTISCMRKTGYNQSQIALAIEKDKSVVCRELKRNSDARNGIYKADLANRKSNKRQKEKHKFKKFTSSVEKDIEDLLRIDYTSLTII